MASIGKVREKKCCGCGACFQICPKGAITMIENSRGFLVPKIDEDKCISCGLCLSVCPEINNLNFNKVLSAHAAISKDKDNLNISTSGGIFFHICRHILNNGGIVYGCAWNSKLSVEHIRVDNLEDLKKLHQSKYIQSNNNNTYLNVKNDLNAKKTVVYSGTACQIAGLKLFLKNDYDNLFTVEVICHGVPSPGLFRKYIQWLEKKYNKKIIKYSFRNKEKHKTGEHYMFSIIFEDHSKKFFYVNEDPYYSSFLSDKILRKCCYSCKYKSKDRISDFTLGDFWGIERYLKKFPARNGVSAVMINSDKAEKLFDQIKCDLVSQKVDIEYVFKGNKSLENSASVNNLVEYDLSDEELFNKLKPKFSFYNKLKNIMPGSLKYILKRLKK